MLNCIPLDVTTGFVCKMTIEKWKIILFPKQHAHVNLPRTLGHAQIVV